MDEDFKYEEQKRSFSPLLIVGGLVGLVVIAIGIYVLSTKPPMNQQAEQILVGAMLEGTPEFAALSKEIIISTDPTTVESPTGMGTISMYVKGNIKNRSSKNITALEVSVSVVTQKKEVLREKRVLAVPVQNTSLLAGEIVPITLTFDGFTSKDDRADIRWKVTAIKTGN